MKFLEKQDETYKMSYSKYDNMHPNKKGLQGKRGSDGFNSFSSGSDYQKFLEYLEKTGPAYIIKQKLFQSLPTAQKKSFGENLQND